MSKITPKKIETIIYVIRGQKVMLDSDLAKLYGVVMLSAVLKSNEASRFPEDFMSKDRIKIRIKKK